MIKPRLAHILIFLALAMTLTLVAAACRDDDDEVKDPVKVGTLLDFTGDLARFGPAMRNGADLAAELINDAGGVLGTTLKLKHKDSGTSDIVATDAARALVNVDGVGAIVGSLSSGVSLAAAYSVTLANQAVLMSPTSPPYSLFSL